MKRLIISILATLAAIFGTVAVATNFSASGANAVEETHQLAWNHKRGADNLPCTGGTLLRNAVPQQQRLPGRPEGERRLPVHDARHGRHHGQRCCRVLHRTRAEQRGRDDLALHRRVDHQPTAVDRTADDGAALDELTAAH